MTRTMYEFVTRVNKDGTATAMNGVLYTPKVKFGGGEVKWYEDKYKENETNVKA